MHKDTNLRKRNALVIPGGLLVATAIVGFLYAAGLRSDAGTCGDASLVVFAGACRSAYLLLAIPLIIGLALLAVGILRFRSRATCRLGHGSWAHFGLAFLIALVVMPALGALLAPSILGPDPVIVSGNVNYPVTTLLAGVALLGLVALVPFALLYSARNRANPCCTEKGCFEPCFCDEAAAPPAEEPMTESLPEAEPLPPAPLPADAMPMPAAEAAVPAESTPAEEWQPVDEPAPAPEPVPQPEPAPSPPPRKAQEAPALASRPSDPAAPPQDAMAVAAKWAEEDEEAARELRAAGSEPPARTRRAPKPAKPAKKPAKAKKSR